MDAGGGSSDRRPAATPHDTFHGAQLPHEGHACSDATRGAAPHRAHPYVVRLLGRREARSLVVGGRGGEAGAARETRRGEGAYSAAYSGREGCCNLGDQLVKDRCGGWQRRHSRLVPSLCCCCCWLPRDAEPCRTRGTAATASAHSVQHCSQRVRPAAHLVSLGKCRSVCRCWMSCAGHACAVSTCFFFLWCARAACG